jgi:microcystin-dependent protein
MASPVKADDIEPLNPAGDLCAEMLNALRLRDQMREFLDWLLDADGNIEDAVLESIADRVNPVGAMQLWPSQSMPSTKWLLCNGQAVSRTTYSKLFARIGTVFGSGDSSTTFNLPNFVDRTMIGAGGTYQAGQTVGSATIQLTEAQVPLKTHYHGIGDKGGGDDNAELIVRDWEKTGSTAYSKHVVHGDTSTETVSGEDTGNLSTSDSIAGTDGTTKGSSHDNIQPSLGVYVIVKAL